MAPRALRSPLSAVPTHSPLSQHAMMGPWKQHPELGTVDKHSLTPETQKDTHTIKGSSPLGWSADQVDTT